jgi:hypothetical protein
MKIGEVKFFLKIIKYIGVAQLFEYKSTWYLQQELQLCELVKIIVI